MLSYSAISSSSSFHFILFAFLISFIIIIFRFSIGYRLLLFIYLFSAADYKYPKKLLVKIKGEDIK